MTSWTKPNPDRFPGFHSVELFSTDTAGERIQPMLVENVLPEGVAGMVVGPPGVSKTQLALTLSIGVASGTPVLGLSVEDARPVIYLANEGNPRDLANRVEWICEDMGVQGSDQLLVQRNLTILTPNYTPNDLAPVGPSAIYTSVHTMAREGCPPGLLVVDTLAPLIEGEENSAESAKAIWAMAHGITNTYGWTVLFIHHRRKTYIKSGKESTGDDLSAIRGTSAHGASARFILGLTVAHRAEKGFYPFAPTGDILELKMIKRNDGPEGFTLNLRRDPATGLLKDISPSLVPVRANTNSDRGVPARTRVETKESQVLKIYRDSAIPEDQKKEYSLRVFADNPDPGGALRSTIRRLKQKRDLPS